MITITLGELADDGTLQHTFAEANKRVWNEVNSGDVTTSYHCFLLARQVRRKKGAIKENEKISDREEFLRWICSPEHSDNW